MRTLLLLCIAVFCSRQLHAAQPQTADIVIYGGTSGGVTAAIQAARMGKSAILIEPSQFLGGLTTGGLGATDIGNKRAIGGLSLEFYGRVYKYYQDPKHWTRESRDKYLSDKRYGGVDSSQTMWTFEPHAATEIYDAMLAEVKDKVTIVKGQRLDLKKGVVKQGTDITKLVMESGQEYTAKMFHRCIVRGRLDEAGRCELSRRTRGQLSLQRNA